MNTNELKTQQDVVDLLDSIDVLGLGISKILVTFDKDFYRQNDKTTNERYIEEYCVKTVSNSLLNEVYDGHDEKRTEPQKSRTIVTNIL